RARLRIPDRFVQLGNLLAIKLPQVGVQTNRRRRRGREQIFEFCLAPFELLEPPLETRCAQTICNSVDKSIEPFCDGGALGFDSRPRTLLLPPPAIHLTVKFFYE